MKTRLLLLLLVFSLTRGGASSTQSRQQNSITTSDNEWSWITRENGKGIEVKVRGKAEFNADYSDLTALSPGGSLRIRDTREATVKEFSAEPDATDSLRRTYSVAGTPVAFDAAARQWLAATLLEMVRQGGFDAPARTARLFQQGGAEAILAEVTHIRSDYVKRLYLTTLLKNHPINSAIAVRLVRQVGREIISDYERRQVLTAVTIGRANDRAVLTESIQAAGGIKSDYERGLALSAVLQQGALGTEALQAVLQAVAGMSSDYEKTKLLMRPPAPLMERPEALPAFFAALDTYKSDYERRRALESLLKEEKVSPQALRLAVNATARMTSDYEKALVLKQVLAASKGNEAVRQAVVESAKGLHSEYERGRVLSAAFK